jgi:hypothetical protein
MPKTEPKAATSRKRSALMSAMTKVGTALETLDDADAKRVLAAAAVMSGAVSADGVLSMLNDKSEMPPVDAA